MAGPDHACCSTCAPAAHVERPEPPIGGSRRAARAAASSGRSAPRRASARTLFSGREVGLISDLVATGCGSPMHRTATAQRLPRRVRAVRRARPRRRSAGCSHALARESTVIAVLGELDPASLRRAGRASTRAARPATALALLLDTDTWAIGRADGTAPASAPRVQTARGPARRRLAGRHRRLRRRGRRRGAVLPRGARHSRSAAASDDRTTSTGTPTASVARRRARADGPARARHTTCGARCWRCSPARSASCRCASCSPTAAG